jgi:hypothetical protein
MLMSEAFPSAYFTAADIMAEPNSQITLQVESCEKEAVGEQGKMQPVLRFSGKQSGLVINKTNSSTLVAAFGNDSLNWRGRKCILYATKTTFKGELTDCIRVRVSDQPEQKPEAAAQVVNVDDDVPF